MALYTNKNQNCYDSDGLPALKRIKWSLKTFFSPSQSDSGMNIFEQCLPTGTKYSTLSDELQLGYDFYKVSYKDGLDKAHCDLVENRVRMAVRGEEKKHIKKLQVRKGELSRAVADIVRLSEHEPYGLRGCTLRIFVQRSDRSVLSFGAIQFDDDTVSTFELHLMLFEQSKWHGISNAIRPFVNIVRSKPLPENVFIASGFTLVRHKLYGQF